MEIRCPHCKLFNTVTFQKADSGEPIYCTHCGKEIHKEGYPLKEGGTK